MKYAIVDGKQTEPIPKRIATCICCGKKLIAKCGNINVWHWSHFPERHCDNWWENETEWHRKWKSYFPATCQEVIHFDKNTGEKHIADIKSNVGIIIELQNSPIKLDELQSRERFYQKMIWIINGERFKKNFHIAACKLPPPDSALAKDLHILRPPLYSEAKACFEGPVIVRKSRGMKGSWGVAYDLSGYLYDDGGYDNAAAVLREIDESYKGHHFFTWRHRREAWVNCIKPVFIDFGGVILFHLERFNDEFHCVRAIDKVSLINSLGGDCSKFLG